MTSEVQAPQGLPGRSSERNGVGRSCLDCVAFVAFQEDPFSDLQVRCSNELFDYRPGDPVLHDLLPEKVRRLLPVTVHTFSWGPPYAVQVQEEVKLLELCKVAERCPKFDRAGAR